MLSCQNCLIQSWWKHIIHRNVMLINPKSNMLFTFFFSSSNLARFVLIVLAFVLFPECNFVALLYVWVLFTSTQSICIKKMRRLDPFPVLFKVQAPGPAKRPRRLQERQHQTSHAGPHTEPRRSDGKVKETILQRWSWLGRLIFDLPKESKVVFTKSNYLL